jgi:shikimate kinase
VSGGVSADPPGDHVALVGLPGSGKSTLAPLLASRLGQRSVVDLDRLLEQQFDQPVSAIFAEHGEVAFRDAESDALRRALDGPPAVIATGGGAVLDAGNRQMLSRSARVVWLRAHPQHLAERLAGSAAARPLLAGDPAFALARLSEEREALYAQVADLVVDVDGVDALDLADEVARSLG